MISFDCQFLFGILQIAQILELSVEVRLSAFKMLQEEAQKKINTIRCLSMAAAIAYLCMGVTDKTTNN